MFCFDDTYSGSFNARESVATVPLATVWKSTGFEHLLGIGLHQIGRSNYWGRLRYMARDRGQKEQKLIF